MARDDTKKSGGAAARMMGPQAVALHMLSFLKAGEVAAVAQTHTSWRGDVGRMAQDGVRLCARWIAEFAAQFVPLRDDMQRWLDHPYEDGEDEDGPVVLTPAARLLTPFEFKTRLPTQHEARAYMQSLYAPLARSAVLPQWTERYPEVRGLLEQGRVGLALADLCFAQRLDAEGRMPSPPVAKGPLMHALRYMVSADPSGRVLGGLVLLELLTRGPAQLGLSAVSLDVSDLFSRALCGQDPGAWPYELSMPLQKAQLVGYAYLLWRHQRAAQVHDTTLRMTKHMTAVPEAHRNKPQARSPYYIRPEWVRTEAWYAVFGFACACMTDAQVRSVIGPHDPR